MITASIVFKNINLNVVVLLRRSLSLVVFLALRLLLVTAIKNLRVIGSKDHCQFPLNSSLDI